MPDLEEQNQIETGEVEGGENITTDIDTAVGEGQLNYDEIISAYETGDIEGYLEDHFDIPAGEGYLDYIENLDPGRIQAIIDQYRSKYQGGVQDISQQVGTEYKTILDRLLPTYDRNRF